MFEIFCSEGLLSLLSTHHGAHQLGHVSVVGDCHHRLDHTLSKLSEQASVEDNVDDLEDQ